MTRSDVEQALQGTVDLHCHPGPNPFLREFDHVEAARDGARLGMRGILSKSHHHNTVMDLLAARELLAVESTPVFGGVALNAFVGGINPYVVAMCLGLGGRAVWFPTLSSQQHVNHGPRHDPPTLVKLPNRVVEIRDANGKFIDEVREVLDLIAQHDALLSSGHLGAQDALELFQEARSRGVRRMVMSHPNHVVGASYETCSELARMGVFIEHEVGAYDPENNIKWDPQVLYDWIQTIGPEQTVLASDLGQKNSPRPVDGFLRVGAILADMGLKLDILRRIACDNPAYLLGVTADVEHVPLERLAT